MTAKVSADDLDVAILWLENYEASDGDDSGERCQRVAEFLRGELKKRQRERHVRELVKETGRSGADVRKAMKARGL